jgi:HK97 family phage portal protein
MSITSFIRGIEEATSRMLNDISVEEARPKSSPKRAGFGSGIPIGGSTETNPGVNVTAGTMDRNSFMEQLLQAYLACPWAATAIDTIARTATAGGLEVSYETTVYGTGEQPQAPEAVKKVQSLLKYINPHEDVRQLMRKVVTDLLIFGDSFTEVVWVMGEPVALYPLDPSTMTVLADEHGVISGYYQKTKTNREAKFKANEVIHVKFDSPGDTLYGVSPTQKNILPITSWLFTAALVKETMKKGDPLRAHVDWPIALPESEMRRFSQQYATRNLGARNIGNLFETKGGTVVHEMGTNQISNWLNTLQQRRDEILSGYGIPPSKVGVIESGNIGGGTGTSQDKMFRVNTVGPIQELILEKFAFALLYQAYGITDWTLKFGVVDWRDDEVIETIRDQRIRNGSWTINRARMDIGEPPISGGDEAVLVDRQNLVLWDDIHDLSKANLALVQAQVKTANMPQMFKTNPNGPDASVNNSKSRTKGLPGASEPPKPTDSAKTIQTPKMDEPFGSPGSVENYQLLREALGLYNDDTESNSN